VQDYRAVIYDYKGFVNPHKSQPLHLFRLVEALIDIHQGKVAPDLVTLYWTNSYQNGKHKHFGVVRALTAYVSYLDRHSKDLALWSVDNNQVWYQAGRGKSRIFLNNSSIKKINQM
jgi:hypothetical protein